MILPAIATTFFWISALVLCYTYVGYPVLIWIMSRFKEWPVRRAQIEPTVSIIISAYNEEDQLRAKLEKTLALDYPERKLEIIVTSDSSTDSTDEVVLDFASRRVVLHRQAERLGKTAAQNAAVRLAHNEILLFSDATTLYRPDVLRQIVSNFADPTVGCVSGRLIYIDPEESSVGQGAKSYWSYESFLKRHESRAASLIGASGCLYAVRRSAYVPLYNEACSDFVIAAKMVEQGLRTVYEPAAVAAERTNGCFDKEMHMRVRVIAQTYADLWRHRSMLNPFRANFFSLQLLSHKVLRYSTPVFLLMILITSLMLMQDSILYAVVAGVQILILLMAVLSRLMEKLHVSSKILALPGYFVLTNVATVLAFFEFLRGNRYTYWEPIRDQTLPKGQ